MSEEDGRVYYGGSADGPQPPCWCCGAEPPDNVVWERVMRPTPTPTGEDESRMLPWTYCLECKQRHADVGPTVQSPPAVDDITHARERIGVMANVYPLLHYQLNQIIGRIEQCFQAAPIPPGWTQPLVPQFAATMPEDWALPVSEVLRLVATVLCDNRITALAKAVDALVERSFTERAFSVTPIDEIPLSFGTPRVPLSARRLILGDDQPIPHGTPAGLQVQFSDFVELQDDPKDDVDVEIDGPRLSDRD